MKLQSYFNDFLTKIRPEDKELNELRHAHKELRKRLASYDGLSEIILTTFLQGSYRRATAIKPRNGKKGDIDVVVVTNIDKNQTTPEQAMKIFIPFLEKFYKGQYNLQGRSIGISLDKVSLDLVITSAPSEVNQNFFKTINLSEDLTLEDEDFNELIMKSAAQWANEPLEIPDREAKKWVRTHPLEQIRVTKEKNSKCNKVFINVVKAIKWWRRGFDNPKYPKGYPVEHLIWYSCPDSVETIAEGFTLSLEQAVRLYPTKPNLQDHGVPEHDVFKRISSNDYTLFYQQVKDAAILARTALNEQDTQKSVELWQKIFGKAFPDFGGGTGKNNNGSSGGYTPRTGPSNISGARFG